MMKKLKKIITIALLIALSTSTVLSNSVVFATNTEENIVENLQKNTSQDVTEILEDEDMAQENEPVYFNEIEGNMSTDVVPGEKVFNKNIITIPIGEDYEFEYGVDLCNEFDQLELTSSNSEIVVPTGNSIIGIAEGIVKLYAKASKDGREYNDICLINIKNASQLLSATVSGQEMYNKYVSVVAGDTNYSMGTKEGLSSTTTDDNKKLLYGWNDSGTSYATIVVDGSASKISASPVFDGKNQKIGGTMYKNNIRIERKIKIIKNSTDKKEDMVEFTFEATNTDTVSHRVGGRIMFDTMLGSNDSCPFYIAGTGYRSTQIEYYGDQIPQHWQVFDNYNNPSVVAFGILYKAAYNRPDKVQFGNWGNFSGSMWEAPVYTGSSNGDSAVTMTWYEKPLAPGEKRVFTTYYGMRNTVFEGDAGISGYESFIEKAEKQFVIPGLSEGLVPQGIAYRKDKDLVYITAYDKVEEKEKPVHTMLYVVDNSTGTCIGRYKLLKPDGSKFSGHAGGVAVSRNNLYIANGKSLARISLATLDSMGSNGEVRIQQNIKLALSPDKDKASISFCDISDGMLWIGNFYYAWDGDYNKKAYSNYKTLIYGYEIDETTTSGLKDLNKTAYTNDYDYYPDIVCSTDEQKIQGVTSVGNKLVLSQSYGRGNTSKMIICKYPNRTNKIDTFRLDGDTTSIDVVKLVEINRFDCLPMMEDITKYNNYSVYAAFESGAIDYNSGKNKTDSVWQIPVEVEEGTHYPVIVLPGIMGSTSTTVDGGMLSLPVLPARMHVPQSELEIVGSAGGKSTGKDTLVSALKRAGNKVYECPYDWRLSIDTIATEYLEPTIKKALRETGKDKVIIVAHSMGGLVARSYIQSSSYDYDVDSLYMLGTPNEGSAQMIPLAQHGIPHNGVHAIVMELNYNIMTGEDYNSASNEEIKRFVNSSIVGATQLLPDYSEQYYETKDKKFKKEFDNLFLKQLNRNAISSGRYQKGFLSDPDKVKTVLLASNSEDTAYAIEITDSTMHYSKPKASLGNAALSKEFVDSVDVVGDGTVAESSAIGQHYNLGNVWEIKKGKYGEHMKLMGKAANEVLQYIQYNTDTANSRLFSVEFTDDEDEELVDSMLQINVSGAEKATLYINDEEIDLMEGFCLNEVPDGNYSIEIEKSADAKRATVAFVYYDTKEYYNNVISFLNDENVIDFSITNGVMDCELPVVKHIRSVENEGKTELLWDENENATLYRIYKKNYNGEDIEYVAETEDTNYLTEDVWINDFDEDCICYYVVPVYGEEEKGYSTSARNYNTSKADFDFEIDDYTVTFKNLSQGEITSYEWDFDGDGEIDSTEENPTYTYGDDGQYDVELIVSGPSGTSSVKYNNAIKLGVYPVGLELAEQLLYVGDSSYVYAHKRMSNDTIMEIEGEIMYESSDPEVISVNENGELTANKIGDAIIKVYAEEMVSTLSVSVLSDTAVLELISDGNGYVDGSGEYMVGENVVIYALPQADEQFEGWYIGDELVSEDAEYTFCIEGDTTLHAVFTNTMCNIIFKDGEDIIATRHIPKGGMIDIPTFPESECRRVDGIYTSDGIPVDETTIFQEDTTVYVRYQEARNYNGLRYFLVKRDTEPTTYALNSTVGYTIKSAGYNEPVALEETEDPDEIHFEDFEGADILDNIATNNRDFAYTVTRLDGLYAGATGFSVETDATTGNKYLKLNDIFGRMHSGSDVGRCNIAMEYNTDMNLTGEFAVETKFQIPSLVQGATYYPITAFYDEANLSGSWNRGHLAKFVYVTTENDGFVFKVASHVPETTSEAEITTGGTTIATAEQGKWYTLKLNFNIDGDAETVDTFRYELTDGVEAYSGDGGAVGNKVGSVAITSPEAAKYELTSLYKLAFGYIWDETTATETTPDSIYLDDISIRNEAFVMPAAPITLVSSDPAANATDVAIDKTITLTFSEAVTNASAQNITISPAVDATITADGDTVTINPDEDFTYGTTYTVTIPNTVANEAGTAATATSFSFTTGADPDELLYEDFEVNPESRVLTNHDRTNAFTVTRVCDKYGSGHYEFITDINGNKFIKLADKYGKTTSGTDGGRFNVVMEHNTKMNLTGEFAVETKFQIPSLVQGARYYPITAFYEEADLAGSWNRGLLARFVYVVKEGDGFAFKVSTAVPADTTVTDVTDSGETIATAEAGKWYTLKLNFNIDGNAETVDRFTYELTDGTNTYKGLGGAVGNKCGSQALAGNGAKYNLTSLYKLAFGYIWDETTATETTPDSIYLDDISIRYEEFTLDPDPDPEYYIDIVGYDGEETELLIPKTISGFSVEKITSISNPYVETVKISSAKTISDYAFKNCEYLRTVCMPYGLAELGSNVFAGCDILTDVYFLGDMPDVIGENSLTNRLGAQIYCYAPESVCFEPFDFTITRLPLFSIIKEPTKKEYEPNEEIDVRGMVLRVVNLRNGEIVELSDNGLIDVIFGNEIRDETQLMSLLDGIEANESYDFSEIGIKTVSLIYRDTVLNIQETATFDVVVRIPVTGISLDACELNIEYQEERQLTATVYPENATNKNVLWRSSDETVATVDSTGKIIGIGTGVATITAETEDCGIIAECIVNVNVPVQGIEFDIDNLQAFVGGEYAISYSFIPEMPTNTNIMIDVDSSEGITINDIDGKIYVYCYEPGFYNVKITSEDGSFTDTVQIQVKNAKMKAESTDAYFEDAFLCLEGTVTGKPGERYVVGFDYGKSEEEVEQRKNTLQTTVYFEESSYRAQQVASFGVVAKPSTVYYYRMYAYNPNEDEYYWDGIKAVATGTFDLPIETISAGQSVEISEGNICVFRCTVEEKGLYSIDMVNENGEYAYLDIVDEEFDQVAVTSDFYTNPKKYLLDVGETIYIYASVHECGNYTLEFHKSATLILDGEDNASTTLYENDTCYISVDESGMYCLANNNGADLELYDEYDNQIAYLWNNPNYLYLEENVDYYLVARYMWDESIELSLYETEIKKGVVCNEEFVTAGSDGGLWEFTPEETGFYTVDAQADMPDSIQEYYYYAGILVKDFENENSYNLKELLGYEKWAHDLDEEGNPIYEEYSKRRCEFLEKGQTYFISAAYYVSPSVSEYEPVGNVRFTIKKSEPTSLKLGKNEFNENMSYDYVAFTPKSSGMHGVYFLDENDEVITDYDVRIEYFYKNDAGELVYDYIYGYDIGWMNLKAGVTYYMMIEANYWDISKIVVEKENTSYLPETFESVELTSESTEITISTPGEVLYYTFSPDEVGDYFFTTEGICDTMCTLYDTDNDFVLTDYDGGQNYNFSFVKNMRKDEKYTLEIKLEDITETGTFTLKIDRQIDPEDVIMGDVNGDEEVDFIDGILILKHDVGLINLPDNNLIAGDVNGDGEVDYSDAILVLKFDVGFITSFKR